MFICYSLATQTYPHYTPSSLRLCLSFCLSVSFLLCPSVCLSQHTQSQFFCIMRTPLTTTLRLDVLIIFSGVSAVQRVQPHLHEFTPLVGQTTEAVENGGRTFVPHAGQSNPIGTARRQADVVHEPRQVARERLDGATFGGVAHVRSGQRQKEQIHEHADTERHRETQLLGCCP